MKDEVGAGGAMEAQEVSAELRFCCLLAASSRPEPHRSCGAWKVSRPGGRSSAAWPRAAADSSSSRARGHGWCLPAAPGHQGPPEGFWDLLVALSFLVRSSHQRWSLKTFS